MTKQPKVRKPHPVLHGIGLVLSVILRFVHDGHHH